MTKPSQHHDPAGLEQLIYLVRGIQAARVVTSENGTIDEIHVVGLPGRSAKQMVRDIESILYVRGGVRLDHRKVSVVQLEEGSPQRQTPRVLLLAVEVAGSQVAVTLGLRERQVVGTAEGGAQCDNLVALTAQATVAAIGKLIVVPAELRVEQTALQPFGELKVCLCHLSMVTDLGVETLLGISMLREDPGAAAARAVLDALNRPLLRLLPNRY